MAPPPKKAASKAEIVTLRPDRDPAKLKAIIHAAIHYDMSVGLIGDEYERLFSEKIAPDVLRQILHTHGAKVAAERLRLLESGKLNPLASRSGRLMMIAAVYRNAANASKHMKQGSGWKSTPDPDRVTMLAAIKLAEDLSQNQREEEKDDESSDYPVDGYDPDHEQSVINDGGMSMRDAQEIPDESGMGTWGDYNSGDSK